jgi:hypothetical protein
VEILRICISQAIHGGNDVHQLMSATDNDGDPLLQICVWGRGNERRPAMIQELILNGANVLQKGRAGHTPEEIARMQLNGNPIYHTPAIKKIFTILKDERLEEIAEQRKLAFAMAWHERLGGKSRLRNLEKELARHLYSH